MKVLVFGEILWDVFPQNNEIGGASLNFGAHLAKLGADVYIVSSVGNDDLGKQSIEIVKSIGINDNYINIIDRPTGVCIVSVDDDGNPTYDLRKDVAYDYISYDHSIKDIKFDAFYMGTLARRSEVSSNTFKKLINHGEYGEVFCDINIRQNFYSKAIIEESLRHCTILKISRDETFVFKELDIVDFIDEKDLAKKLAYIYNIKIVIVTLDKDGAMLYSYDSGNFYESMIPTVKAISTVGAGDSFSACFLYNYLKGVNISDCLNRAVILSSFVVTKLGAVPEYNKELLKLIT